MMFTVIKLILSILIPFSAGYVFLIYLFRKQVLPLSLMIALSYGLGLGLLAIWMLCLFICQQTFHLSLIRTPFVLVTIFAFLFYLIMRKPVPTVDQTASTQKQINISQNSLAKTAYIIFVSILVFYCAQNIFYIICISIFFSN